MRSHVHAGDQIRLVPEGKGKFLGAKQELDMTPGSIPVASAGESRGVKTTGRKDWFSCASRPANTEGIQHV